MSCWTLAVGVASPVLCPSQPDLPWLLVLPQARMPHPATIVFVFVLTRENVPAKLIGPGEKRNKQNRSVTEMSAGAHTCGSNWLEAEAGGPEVQNPFAV